MDWPPPYRSSTGDHGELGTGAGRRFPPAGWPSQGELDYAKELIVVLVLMLALPYVVYMLLTRPSAVVGGAARQVIVRRVSG